MGKKLWLLLFFNQYLLASAQIDPWPVSITYSDVLAFSNNHLNVLSPGANTAALASLKEFSAGMHAERRYLLKELHAIKAAFMLPVPGGSFGVQAAYAGNIWHNQATVSLAYARQMGKIQAGLGFGYQQLKTTGYGRMARVLVEAGMLFKPTEKLTMGWQVCNPLGIIREKEKETAPFIFSFGLGLDISRKCYLGAVLKKGQDRSISLDAGCHYQFLNKASAHAGISTTSRSFYLGTGYRLKHLGLQLTISMHPYLGSTPGLTFLYHKANP